MDWDAIFAHRLIGQYTIKIDLNHENISKRWIPLSNEQQDKQGELLVSIEVENIWIGVKEVSINEKVTAKAGRQRPATETNPGKKKNKIGSLFRI
ncbi:hypothetical protein RFI_08311 [Reticulomyxa filosa]|uniref:Uncharacterized protein n=1 Tax=Reticulomyxa filosa TaxID=46433 RepID=X6NS37_RETFI|nr:hypothetical protein RFI_08311 [Reticulomyxa filosa]|eukprot:ETO28816.1 hypothetical protein RFI_08311 [Reticulomyxa filosa]